MGLRTMRESRQKCRRREGWQLGQSICTGTSFLGDAHRVFERPEEAFERQGQATLSTAPKTRRRRSRRSDGTLRLPIDHPNVGPEPACQTGGLGGNGGRHNLLWTAGRSLSCRTAMTCLAGIECTVAKSRTRCPGLRVGTGVFADRQKLPRLIRAWRN